MLYRYKAEDGVGVDLVMHMSAIVGTKMMVVGRPTATSSDIHYGNRTPLLDNVGRRPRFLDKPQIEVQIGNADWMFEAVFDYGDHNKAEPKPNDDEASGAVGVLKFPWRVRPDPFSTYRSGFEVRTTRLCQRILMFHHFPGEVGVERDCRYAQQT